ncbi:MAG: hypothetical protein WBE34_00915 [Candidatus Nitrosopolaris sp.]
MVEDPGNPCWCHFGSSQPELTYFSLPIIVYSATSDQTKKTTDIGMQVMMIASACGLE